MDVLESFRLAGKAALATGAGSGTAVPTASRSAWLLPLLPM